MTRQLEEKDRELQDLRKAKQDAEIEKEEKMAKSEALDSALGESRDFVGEFQMIFRIAEKAIRRRRYSSKGRCRPS